LEACDIVLMGRRTYEVFAPAWSSRSGDRLSDRINTMRKVVASTTLTDGAAATFDLVDARVLSNGIVLATYTP
jgi:dihydrofolate reductase